MKQGSWRAFGLILFSLGLASCGGGGAGTTGPQTPASALLQPVPGDETRMGVSLYPRPGVSSRWAVWRSWPDGAARVYERDSQGSLRLRSFAAGVRIMPLQIVEDGAKLYLFAYDVERNIPSGRDPNIVREGVDIYRFGVAESVEPTLFAQDLALGGLDNLIHASVQGDQLAVCAINKCLTVSEGVTPQPWDQSALAGREFIEVQFQAGEAQAIVRTAPDHVTGDPVAGPAYLAARLGRATSSAEPVPDGCLPYRLRAGNTGPTYSCATTTDALAEVLKDDLDRMPHGGLMEFAASNMEGRIAWSSVYYLRGLVHLEPRYLPHLAGARDWSPERRRAKEEIDLIAKLGESGPTAYLSRRYSRDRMPLLFALHLGRIAHMLHASEQTGWSSPRTTNALRLIQNELASLDDTVETSIVQPFGASSYQTLGLRRGSAFWADGSNTPHNFVSAYTLGLLAAESPSAADIDRAADLLLPLLEVESIASADHWHYWWGRGYTGWTAAEAVSVNTASYGGQQGIAHITYRSMDAMAVVRLHALAPARMPRAAVDNVGRLVEAGLLLPFVNEELARIDAVALQPPGVAIRLARSAAPWELQAQLWALEALASR